MKKYFWLILVSLFFITGCGKFTKDDAIKNFKKQVENSKSYKLNGVMEISNGEEIFTYSLETNFLKDDYYKVVLVNQTNNHEQVILKNNDGLYVVTPNLNKSFKFDSTWPDNSSQSYLLNNLLTDIKDDNESSFEEKDNNYIIKCKVNYPNNEDLKYEKIYFDKKMNLEKVEVFDKNDIVKIKVTVKGINLKARLDEDDFKLEDLVDEVVEDNSCIDDECDDKTGSLDSIIYPLYIPVNTHLVNSEGVDLEKGDRVILTFGGEKNFVIVEEVAKPSDEIEIIPVFGEPLLFNDSIGAMSPNSISWSNDNISYYLVGNDLTPSELVSIASSLGNTKTVISQK